MEAQNIGAQDAVKTQKERIGTLESEAVERSAELDGVQRELEATRKELSDCNRALSETQDRLAETTAARDNLNDRYERIKTTFSWKSTMPLRAMRRFFHK